MGGYDGFAPIYDSRSAAMTEDIDYYVELAREADGPLVEVAVSTGRLAIPNAARIRPFDEQSREYVWVARKPE